MTIMPLDLGSAPNDGNGQDLRSGGQVINENFAELDQRTSDAQGTADSAVSALADKVDKADGMGLSSNDYTDGEKTKLAGLESSHFRGSFVDLDALVAGVAVPVIGDYADVDEGIDVPVVRYIWDATDNEWIKSGAADPLTAAQVKVLYESNPDTNAFTDDDKSSLGDKAEKGDNSDITSLSGLTTPLSVEQGGTGANSPEGARSALELGSVATEDIVPVAKGGTGATTAALARTALQLGDAALADVVGLVDDGAIIESGTSANGSWTKWADGTMICTGYVISPALAITTAYFGGFRSTDAFVDFPQEFIEAPSVVLASSGQAFSAVPYAPTTTQFRLNFTAVTSQTTASAREIRWSTTGRWKA